MSSALPRVTLVWSLFLTVAVAGETPPPPAPTQAPETKSPPQAAPEQVPAPTPKQPSDEELAADVRTRLDHDPYVAGWPIDVAVLRGVVTLHGSVGSSFLRTWAEDTARGVFGVTAVSNELGLDHVPPRKRDWQVAEEIRWRLGVSPGVRAEAVAVQVREGVAYLTGTVRTEEEERIVVRQAARVAPRLVVNHLTVRELAPVVRGEPLPAGMPLGPPGVAPLR